MASDVAAIERKLWSAADQLRANSKLKPSEYSRPVLGLLFLRYADGRFAAAQKQMQPKPGSRLGAPGPDAYKARGIIYLTPEARFSHLLALPEGADLGRALNQAMDDIEKHNSDLSDALPKNYGAVPDDVLRELIKSLAPVTIDGDAFGRVYEYFMGAFAMQEMQKGGEFYTPSSIDRALSRPHPRSGLRLGRHVRAFGRFRARSQPRAGTGACRSSASRRSPRRSASPA